MGRGTDPQSSRVIRFRIWVAPAFHVLVATSRFMELVFFWRRISKVRERSPVAFAPLKIIDPENL